MAKSLVELAQGGQVTIPKQLRDQHQWETGQQFTLLDLDGVVVMSPKEASIDSFANQLRDDLLYEGTTLEEMLMELRRGREHEARTRES